jgi:Zn-dependent protease with chaperone function
MILRAARWAWPLLFFLPLTMVANRGCEFPGVDGAYHSALWLHENLPTLFLIAGLLSVGAVIVQVARVRARAATLFSLESPMPSTVASAFKTEAVRLNMRIPRVAYLDVNHPLCFALVGVRPAIVLSRGFIQDLDDREIGLIVRHELLHVRHGDPTQGFAWHIAFAALLLPAFAGLERWLASRRELRTNLKAAAADPAIYAELLRSRARNQRDICVEAFAAAERPRSLATALAQPLVVLAVLVALVYSHEWFLQHLEFLTSHHC